VQAFWDAPSMQDGVNALALADPERFSCRWRSRRDATGRCGAPSLGGEMDRSAQATRAARGDPGVHQPSGSGLTLLASIGATAPFVGLLGTVWGIYHALANVSSHGTVQIDKVAGPVGEALVMTAIGLTVAIPAVLAYNGFNRVNRLTLAELDAFAHDLHAYLTK
jgi:biopolymer transport protein ExbB